jgi:HD superfamily phosphodiesterase
VAASSTGKYHPSYTLGDGGLIRHTKGLLRIMNHMLNLEQYSFFLDREKDLIRVAGLLHDSWKHGDKGSGFTVHEHPKIAAEYTLNFCNNNEIPLEEMKFVSNCIESHMGQWATSKRSSVELPKPSSESEKLLHLCDYLASRKDIEILFDETTVQETIKPEDYIFPFGKYKDKKLSDVMKNDADYIRWAKENITREPLKSILKKI